MYELKAFKHEEFGEIRTVEINGEPWMVGKDVAAALGYAKPENAISAHVDEEDKTTTLIQGTGSNYKSNAVIINESGLYSLILSSKLPGAKRFKRWVTSEVLPAIRKTGSYGTPIGGTPPKAQSLSEAISLGKFVRGLLKDQGANPYQTAEIVLDTMKQVGVNLSDKLMLPVKLDAVRGDELDMVEFKMAFPESTWHDYIAYRTFLKLSK